MNQDYDSSELEQAERLERYLVNLEQGQLAPRDANQNDIALFKTARWFQASRVQPRTLKMPVSKPSWSLRRFALWLTPLPLVAAAAVVYVVTRQPVSSGVDISGDLAIVDQTNNELLALQEDLDQSLAEIDLLTSTEYLDQL